MSDYMLNDDGEAKDILIELRESTGMNRNQFCEYFAQWCQAPLSDNNSINYKDPTGYYSVTI